MQVIGQAGTEFLVKRDNMYYIVTMLVTKTVVFNIGPEVIGTWGEVEVDKESESFLFACVERIYPERSIRWM